MNARERWAAEELALLRAALPRTVKVDAEQSREIAGWKRIGLGLDDGSVVELEATANDEGFAAIDVVAFAATTERDSGRGRPEQEDFHSPVGQTFLGLVVGATSIAIGVLVSKLTGGWSVGDYWALGIGSGLVGCAIWVVPEVKRAPRRKP